MGTSNSVTKFCNKCKTEKLLHHFRLNAKGRPVTLCTPCHDQYKREWFYRLGTDVKEFLFDYLSRNPCVRCGESNILALHFDHQSNKQFNIGRAIIQRKTLDEVQAEIAKCVVLCANCHSIKTAKEQNTWRYQMTLERG